MPDAVVPLRAKQYVGIGQWWHFSYDTYDENAAGDIPTSLTLITWNVDFSNDFAAQRLTAALDYLRDNTFKDYKGKSPPFCIILLQEIQRGVFHTLLAHPWVKEHFMVVPGKPEEGWPHNLWYGTVTLVRKGKWLAGSTCVYFGESRMGRNALVTDVLLKGGGAEPSGRVLRVVNTHLESLQEGTPHRVVQLGVIAGLLKEAEGGGIVGGDMNAIAPSDATLAEQNGLLDAWEERGRHGREGVEEEEKEEEANGVTWGFQPICKYPPGRLDKILYTENDTFEVKDIQRFGIGLRLPLPHGECWVSDHYGLMCQVEARQTTSRGVGD